MPSRPAYFHRIAEALDALRGVSTDWVDRRMIEELLGVSKTVAWRVMRRCGAADGPGNTIVCGRDTLIRSLEALMETGECEREIRRRARVEASLDQLLAVARSRHIQVAPASRSLALASSRFKKLPAGVELTPERLSIEFSGMKEFLEKFGAIVFALQNDYDAMSQYIEHGGASGSS
jgi:hypothetical protein